MTFFIHLIGYLLIYIAVDVGRPQEHKVKMFTSNWWIIVGLVTIGTILTGYNN